MDLSKHGGLNALEEAQHAVFISLFCVSDETNCARPEFRKTASLSTRRNVGFRSQKNSVLKIIKITGMMRTA
jgi:hypothetical protein